MPSILSHLYSYVLDLHNLWWEIFSILSQTIALSAKPINTHDFNSEHKLWGPHTLKYKHETHTLKHEVWSGIQLWSYLLVTHTGVKYDMITSKCKRNSIIKAFSHHMMEDVMKNGMKNLWNHFKDSIRFHDFKCFERGWKLMWLLCIYQPIQVTFSL